MFIRTCTTQTKLSNWVCCLLRSVKQFPARWGEVEASRTRWLLCWWWWCFPLKCQSSCLLTVDRVSILDTSAEVTERSVTHVSVHLLPCGLPCPQTLFVSAAGILEWAVDRLQWTRAVVIRHGRKRHVIFAIFVFQIPSFVMYHGTLPITSLIPRHVWLYFLPTCNCLPHPESLWQGNE